MKKIALLLVGVSMIFASVSCSGDDSPSPTNNIDQESINGWWYATEENDGPHYKAYYFGEDGEYKQDMSNYGLGMGTGTWEWEDSNTIKMTPDADGGIAGGVQYPDVTQLTDDTLILTMGSQEVILDRTE